MGVERCVAGAPPARPGVRRGRPDHRLHHTDARPRPRSPVQPRPLHSQGNPICLVCPSKSHHQVDRTVVSPGEEVTVELAGEEFGGFRTSFKGFLLTARSEMSNFTTTVGSFTSLPAGSKSLDCEGKSKSAVTHRTSAGKTAMSLQWIPASSGYVQFFATFVQHFSTFWVKIPSERICVKLASGNGCEPETTSKTEPDTTKPTPEVPKEIVTKKPRWIVIRSPA